MTSDVRKQSPIVAKMAEDWPLIDALMGGTKAMRQAGEKYLPKWPAEDAESYKSRLATATLFPAYSRTVSVLTGKPFSKQITIGEDVPARLVDWLENVDLQDRNLHSFASDICIEALAWGISGILVDCPPKDPSVKTKADEIKIGLRPYFVHVNHAAILGWQTARVNGAKQLTQLRLLEMVEEASGEFGVSEIEQVRVLTPGGWATWRKARQEDDDSWQPYKDGATTLSVIPFVPIYGHRKDFMVGCAPMLELGHANVEHFQSKSDQQTILHVARVPILFTKDIGDTPIVAGAGASIRASSKDADAKYVEHTGAAIEAGRKSLLDLEDRMRQIGAELLVIKPGNTTQVQTIADNEMGMCDLQRIMQATEDGLDQALDFMAMWVGEKDGGHVSIYRDFGAATLAEASADLLFDMQSAGSLKLETLLSELKRRGILSPDIDIEKEIVGARAEAAARPPVQVQELVKP